MERIVNERDVVQVVNEMKSIWREQMIKGYRGDPVYQLAQDTSNTSRGGKMQDYRIRNGLLYAPLEEARIAFISRKGMGSMGKHLGG